MPNLTVDHIQMFFSSFYQEKNDRPSLKRAAVLVPLFERNGELHVMFTKRTNEVEHHKGQVSFPGGAMDETDTTIIETALQEAEEEIGLSRNTVYVLGVHNDFCTPSGFCITPVIAFLPFLPSFSINTTEVSELFDVPLSFFLNSRNERVERRGRTGKVTNVYFYRYGNYEIWGVTAAILRSFLYDLVGSFGNKKPL